MRDPRSKDGLGRGACYALAAAALLGWLVVAAFFVAEAEYLERSALAAVVAIPLAAGLLSLVVLGNRRRLAAWAETLLERNTAALEDWPARRVELAIALAAGLGLFAELAIVRLHSSQFQLFAYFKNVSLLSCFLGLGIGYARGSARRLALPLALPLLAAQLVLHQLLLVFGNFQELQNPVPEQISFGLRDFYSLPGHLGVHCFIAFVFVLNALCFVPLGQLAARLMLRVEPLRAYAWNLLGSLAGIVVFYLISFLWAPPAVWMLIVVLGTLPFLRDRRSLAVSAAAGVIVLVALGWPSGVGDYDVYSPYQKLSVGLRRAAPPEIQVSNVYYQRMLDLRSPPEERDERLQTARRYYDLPYRVRPLPGKVLVVGSGTGNDVAAALRHGADAVDAVEIDPAILDLGRRFHPEDPYGSPRVRVINDDARAWLRSTDRKYDLIVYGLLDSHTLLANVASVRLDGFVYTVEGFVDARSRLADGGILVMTFAETHPRLQRKIFLMLRQAFDGRRPLLFSSGYDNGSSFVVGGGLDAQRLARDIGLPEISGRVAESTVEAEPATDDWPFLYMPSRSYPRSYLLIVVLLTLISLALIRRLAPIRRGGLSWPCFFLGAGFMLLETKGITELALVFGSTWIVVGTVITVILVLAFLANAAVRKLPRLSAWSTYPALVGSVLVGLVLVKSDLSGLPEIVLQCVLTFGLLLPLFFSGLAFSSEIGRAASVASAVSSNLLGAMLGGFLEYNAMYFGYQLLYYLAIATYLAALVTSLRARR